MASIDFFSQKKLKKIKEKELFRELKNFAFLKKNFLEYRGKKYLSFTSNDYFGLKNHPKTNKVAIKSIKKYGFAAGSSRLITGNHFLYQKLEAKLAKINNCDQSIVFGSGYLGALGIIPVLAQKHSLIIADKLIHSSLIDGIKLSGADFKRYHHNDLDHLERIIKENQKTYQNILIITETIFSMDGDKTDMKKIIKIAKKYNSWLLTDDAHSISFYQKNNNEFYQNHIKLGTLSKSLASYGGYVAASKNICNLIINQAKTLIYTTALPIPNIAVAIESLNILQKNNKLEQKLTDNIKYFSKITGLESQTAIFKIEFQNITEMQKTHKKLLDARIWAGAIRPPTATTPRIRITINANHSKKDLGLLAKKLNNTISI